MRSHPVKCSTSNEISICKIGNHCKNANAHTLEKQELVIGPKKKIFFCSYSQYLVITIYTPFFKQRELPKKDFGLGR